MCKHIGWNALVVCLVLASASPALAQQQTVNFTIGGFVARSAESRVAGDVLNENGTFLVFDLDESRDFELLHGKNGVTEYLIPFREIASIKPDGSRRSIVQLRMGLTIELEESQDVTRENDGVLVFAGGQKPRYIDWRDVDEIRFR